jgi:phage replication-related protein YjqB (UPF0714/DUF867 family)
MSTSRQSVAARKHAPPEELAAASSGSGPNQISAPDAYDARILKLRLPEQDKIKNASERCSVDLTTLKTIGRKRGEQIRIKRKDDARFVALYTVKQANPDTGPASADVVRAGQTARARLGTIATMAATVQARVVDVPPQPDEPEDVRFFELAKDCGKQTYFIAIAPHGGQIEQHTDEQAVESVDDLVAADFPASWWLCKGFGDANKGAHDRWHITSTDLQPACFPLLRAISSRRFCYGVAFHGFQQKKGEADLFIGGAAPRPLKRAIERHLKDLALPIEVKISTGDDSPKFQGFSPENLINRLARRGIHLEQSLQARKFHREIAQAVAKAFRSRLRLVICILVEALEKKRSDARTELVAALRKDLAAGPIDVERAIERDRAWRARDRALTTNIELVEELEARL